MTRFRFRGDAAPAFAQCKDTPSVCRNMIQPPLLDVVKTASTVALPLVDFLQPSAHQRRLVVRGQVFGVVAEWRDAPLVGQHADRPGPVGAPHATIQPERIDDPQYRLPDIVVGERLVRHCAGAGDAGRQFGSLPNMIQPPLLGVVNAASAVSARTVTWRGPAVPRSCSMLSVYIAVRQRPVPRLPPDEQSGCGPSTRISPA